jgi:hypothetical protein
VLILILLLTAVALAVLLWAGTLFFQGYLYTEPVSELYWRAPAAGAVLALFLGLWCLLDYNNPDSYDTLFRFHPSEGIPFTEFWSQKQMPNGKLGPNVLYEKKRGARFVNAQNEPWRKAENQLIVGQVTIRLKDGSQIEFRPVLNEKGKFKYEAGQTDVRFVEVGNGRELYESELEGGGTLPTSHPGLFWMNLLLNFAHLGVWFACLWLLLQFQWPHALGLAAVLWLITTLTVLPMLLDQTRTLAREEAAPRATARRGSGQAGSAPGGFRVDRAGPLC